MRKKDLEKETYLSEYKLAYITAGDAVLIDCKATGMSPLAFRENRGAGSL